MTGALFYGAFFFLELRFGFSFFLSVFLCVIVYLFPYFTCGSCTAFPFAEVKANFFTLFSVRQHSGLFSFTLLFFSLRVCLRYPGRFEVIIQGTWSNTALLAAVMAVYRVDKMEGRLHSCLTLLLFGWDITMLVCWRAGGNEKRGLTRRKMVI